MARQKQGVVSDTTTRDKSAAQGNAEAAYGQLPLAFEINDGQSDPRVKFLCRGAGYGLFLTSSDTVLALTRPAAKGVQGPAAISKSGDILRFKLVGTIAEPPVEGLEPLPGKSNYFIGSDPKQWRTNVPQYARVKSGQIYPGIDLVYYGRQRQLEYDFQVAPGADPGAIRFTIQGARKVSLNAHGDLVMRTPGGDVVEQAPLIYQEVGGKREAIDGGYEVRRIANAHSTAAESYAVNFRVAAYDRARPLVVDPVLSYSTYLAGSNGDDGEGIAVDGSGNAYLTGETDSANFPTTTGAFQTTLDSGGNAPFIMKLNATGTALIYSTYIGGGEGSGIAVDGSGDAYITGETDTGNFPTTPGAYKTTGTFGGNYQNSNRNVFVAELNPAGTALVYSTYAGAGNGLGIAVDGSGNAYVTGYTESPNFPTSPGAIQTAFGGTIDGQNTDTNAFVIKLNATGSAVIYSTYLGGSDGGSSNNDDGPGGDGPGGDEGSGITVDGSGNAYVTGRTEAVNFPHTSGAYRTTLAGSANAFVAKLNETGTALVYSTYLGGSAFDEGLGIALDSSSNAYVTGYASSTNFPTTGGALQTTLGGSGNAGSNAFVTELNATGTALVYSTYLGGGGYDYGVGIAVDSSSNAYVTGQTNSQDFPTTGSAFQGTLGASGFGGGGPGSTGNNAFVTKLNAAGTGLVYSTYLGGNNADNGNAIAVDGSGDAYITGQAYSPNFPTTSGALQTGLGSGARNAFATELNPTGAALVYSTYIGGGGAEEGSGIAVDGTGSAYVTGHTTSTVFPTTTGASQTALGASGAQNVFITKLNPAGTALIYSTYLGGSLIDSGAGIAVDGSGDAYITGYTSSTNFPATPGAVQSALGGSGSAQSNAFVTELNATGAALVYSTYLGGSGSDNGAGIALDSSSNAYITGFTSSTDFPTTLDAFQTTLGGSGSTQENAFVTKLNATGTALVYSTYLGGNARDYGLGIAVDGSGNAYVTGSTSSTDFPTTSGAFQTRLGGGGSAQSNAFVTKLNAGGAGLVYSTYLGGSLSDGGNGIAVDSSDAAYVTGATTSTDFPIAGSAYLTSFGGYGGNSTAFVTKLDAAGTALVYSTYLGGGSGGNGEAGNGIAIDSAGNAYVTGYTVSSNFPTTADALQINTGGGTPDGFVTKLNPTGSALVYSTLLATNGVECSAIALDGSGNAYVTGYTTDNDFPTTNGAFQTSENIGSDFSGGSSTHAFVAELGPDGVPSISNYGVNKQEVYLQHSAAAPVISLTIGHSGGDYVFHASVSGTNIGDLDPVPSVTLPNATVDTLTYESDSDEWNLGNVPHSFTSKSAMDAAFPDGHYTMSVGGTNVTLNLSPDSYPPTPTLTSGEWDGKGGLVVNAVANYTFNFNDFEGYANGGAVQLQIYTITVDGNGQSQEGSKVADSFALSTVGDPLPTSYSLAANVLQPNTTYYAELSFAQLTDINNTAIPAATGGIAYFGRTTGFTIDTTAPTGGQFFFTVPGALVQNTAGEVTITVSRNFSSAASVDYQTVDDTAVAGIEYSATQGTLNFAAGQTQATITVPILQDDSAPATTDFSIQLSNPTSGDTIGTQGGAGIFIVNGLVGNLTLPQGTLTPPQAAPVSTGSITVDLSPSAAEGQWRLFGELNWRDSGDTAAGLTAGNYEVEFETSQGYQQPPLQVVPLLSGSQALVSGTYTIDGSPTTGSLQVNLAPQGTGGWRFQGENAWRSSGVTVANLNTGDYILEFEPVTGLVTPQNCEAVVYASQIATITITYLVGDSTIGQTPILVSDTVAETQAPYVFTGQIQTDEGLGSGFVPLDRVVVTAAHVLFDDSTLSYVEGVRWFFQYESGEFEAPAQIPAGSYVLSGYAALRASDIGDGVSPGVATTASRQLDAAALYFLEPAARGGQSGYLASNSADNPWLTGTTGKFIAGYPVTGVTPTGRLYATPIVQNPFQYVTGSLFSTSAITSYSGNSGGPLFVHYSDGNFYPAAIYLGGSEETIVHAIDSNVIALMNEAEVSGNGGANNSGGGIIQVTEGISGDTASALGSVNVALGPTGAVSHGAYWEIGDGVKRYSGQSVLGLAPGSYTVRFFGGGPGYSLPATQANVSVTSGIETDVTAIYTPNAPTITSGTQATAIEGQPFSYQIAVIPDATGFATTSGALPSGLTLNGSTGLISGAVPIGATPGVSSISLQATNGEGPGNPLALALTLALPGKLTVSLNGEGAVPKAFNNPSIQAVGSSISIKATPARGFLFAYWSDADTGDVLSTQQLYKFSMPVLLDLQANFVANPFLTAKGSYLALLQGTTYSESGFAQLAVAPSGAFSATINLGGSAAKVRGVFDNLGQFEGVFTLPGNGSFKANLLLTAGGVLTGVITSQGNGSQIALSAERIATHADQNLAGAYTVLLPAASGTIPLPGGNGYGALTISKTGAVRFSGKLGDALPVTLAGSLDSNGIWPFLFVKAASKKAGAELLLGSIAFPPPISGTSGTLTWYRTASINDPVYRNGFSITIPFVAGRYVPPAVSSSNAVVTFSGGDLVTPLMEPVSIDSRDRVTPGGALPFTLKFTSGTGLFTGSFPDNGSVRVFAGAVLQSGSTGMGLFEEKSGQTGSVLLSPAP